MEKSSETKLEYVKDARFYAKEPFGLGIADFPIGTVITIIDLPVVDKDGSTAGYRVTVQSPTCSASMSFPSNLRLECLERLPLAPDRRKGPVSSENPLSPERRAELLSFDCEMRSDLEKKIRDLVHHAVIQDRASRLTAKTKGS